VRTPKVEIYRTYRRSKPYEQASVYNSYEYRWRFRAANGRIVAESGEGYLEPRNLVRGLEIAHPGYTLAVHALDADLDPDQWCLHADWQHAYPPSVDALGHIPVTVPEGTTHLWNARRKR
jgi:hypothetical protein